MTIKIKYNSHKKCFVCYNTKYRKIKAYAGTQYKALEEYLRLHLWVSELTFREKEYRA